MLGGVSKAGAEDVSSLWSGMNLSGFEGSFPALPQNWADLPFRLSLNQGIQYNSNIFNDPNSVTSTGLVTLGKPVGDYISTTNLGFATTFRVNQQEFFADASYGIYRYLNHANQNRAHNSGDLGMNWVAGQRCTGRFVFAAASSPSAPGEQIGVNVINTVTTESFNETANCTITGNWSATLNSGYSKSTNSAAADATNNFRNVFLSAGVNYHVTETNTIALTGTVSHYEFPNRGEFLASLLNSPALLSAALDTLPSVSSATTLKQLNLSYTKDISPNLSIIASAGLSSNSLSGIGSSVGNRTGGSGVSPQFSFSAHWSITPKVSLSGSIARVVTPPTNTVGNVQTNESATMSLDYKMTPKLSFSTGASVTRTTSGLSSTNSSAVLETLFPNLAQSRNYGLNAGLNYTITPFISSGLTYSYYKRVQTNQTTTSNIFMLALTYAPR